MANIELILAKAMKQVMVKDIKPALDTAISKWKVNAERFSPIDEWDYIEWFETKPVKLVWNTLVWELNNNDSKATGVEYGRRKTSSKWSKQWWSPVVEFWVGARVFDKTNEVIKQDFRNNLTWW